MERLMGLEYPQPRLKLSLSRIDIETPGGFEGSFDVTNVGGAELEGEIFLDYKGVMFYPQKFKGNAVQISYSLNLASYRPGDVFRRDALIKTNGGEAVIPIEIKIVPPEIKTKEGRGIASLDDFYEYAGQSPVAARQLFNQWEFAEWLNGQGYGHMELYERLVSDPNKERAVDNFLMVNGIKAKAAVKAARRVVVVKVAPGQTEPIRGEVQFKRLSAGYAEVRLSVLTGEKWLTLEKERVTSGDFVVSEHGDARAAVPFTVAPAMLRTRVNAAYIDTESENGKVGGTHVFAVVERAFKARLSKDLFQNEDSGFVVVENSTGKDLMMEVTCNDKHVKFGGKKYLIGAYAEIPFTVKVSGLQTVFRKQPLYETQIDVKTEDGKLQERTLKLMIGRY